MSAVLGPIGSLGGHALAYAARGLEVFPLHADKTPQTEHGMKDATTDVNRVEAWWDRWPDALIGCRIPAGVVVIDVDPKHSGMATWKLLKDTFGKLPLTRTHQSGRNDGGGHLWVARPNGKLSVRRLNRWARDHGVGEQAGKHSWVSGIDLLHHDHRYTILPPSPHPATGAPYRWVERRDLDTAPAEMPAWLAELVTEDPEPLVPAPRMMSSEVESIADWFSATASWGDLLVSEGWTLVRGDGDSDGSRWRHPNATATYSATISNGCLFVYSDNTDFEVTSEGDPHGYTRFRALTVLGHRGDGSAAARAARELRDGPRGPQEDWGWVGLTNGVGGGASAVETPGADSDGLRPINWDEFWHREHSGEDWLVEPILPLGRQVALWAVHKTGKSLIALEMVAAAACGRSCLGSKPIPPVDVVYLDFEMTEDDLWERLDDMGYGPEVDMSRLHYYLLPSLPALDTDLGGRVLTELAVRHDAKLVVIDTMSRVVEGEENEADTYRAFYRHSGNRLKALGITLLRLDHGGKDTDRGQRGSSAKGDDVDLVWQLTGTDSGLQLDRKASRMGWVPERVTLTRHNEYDDLHHTLALAAACPAGTKEMADLLDSFGLPLSVGRREAQRILKERQGKGARNDVLGAALKYRRQAAEKGLV